MNKEELINKVNELQTQLDKENSRPTGVNISNCSIDMGESSDLKIAVAEAVKEGMIALQNIEGTTYGVYVESGAI